MRGSVIGPEVSAADADAPCLMWTRQQVAELFDHAIAGTCSASVLPAM
jgi:hypothetical protein